MANKIKQVRALRELQVDLMDEMLVHAQSAVADNNICHIFQLRYKNIDQVYEEFEKQHSALIALIAVTENPDFAVDKEVRSSFMKQYFEVQSIYANLFPVNRENNLNVVKSSNVQLPKISLPSFDGEYKEWPTFFDLFSSLIHRNLSLSNIEKFQYLMSSLSKEPLSLIKNIPLTEENYNNAFSTLTERYQNKRLLASTCWQEIYNAPKLTNESVHGLRKLLETFSENLAALEILGLPVGGWDFILCQLLIQKLDVPTVRRFELQEGSTEIPLYSTLRSFLLKQCTALESVSLSTSKVSQTVKNKLTPNNPQHSYTSSKRSSSFVLNANNKTQISCNYCKSSHSIYKCSAFLAKTPSERFQTVRDNHWCTNCLHSAHRVSSCGSQITCRICKGKHHTLLHISRDTAAASVSATSVDHASSHSLSPDIMSPSTSTAVNSLSNVISSKATVLLSTARVDILDVRGHYQSVRVLLDCASQTNIISQKCLNRLGLPCSNISLSIFGLGRTSSSASRGVTCTIRPKDQSGPQFTIDTVVLPKICSDMPSTHISVKHWEHIANLKLADPHFHIPSEIDLLLGADVFPLILRSGRVLGKGEEPTAIETVFGWILMGKIRSMVSHGHINSFFISLDSSLDQTLKKFWELEEVPQNKCSSPEDSTAEKIFVDSYFREPSGRYSVALPFKGPEPFFEDSRSIALRRFYSLERRLLHNTALYQSYCEFMRDYLESNHMELASLPPVHSQKVFYIPHHCVVNPSSLTTKLRVVFDASCRTVGGESLNDKLLVGPKLQKDIVTLLLNFRLHFIVFTADIKQMYRQINIHPRQRDYQRILWRFSSDHPVQEFLLKTVTYGISSAPYLAIRTLLQLAEDENNHFPRAAQILRSDVYVDDIITGCSTLEEALILKNQLISLLQKGGFDLRKWASNSLSFLETIPECDRQLQSLPFHADDSVVKILGLKWLPTADVFSYTVESINRPCTKRSILSELARIFDPLGFLAPITFFAKYLIQYLWTLGLSWDETPPSEVLTSWAKYKSELTGLVTIKIPRCLIPNKFFSCQLHGFSDSSEKGYSAVVYLRFQVQLNQFVVSLVCAKSKVSPLKRISLPRLELCGAVLLSNLISFVIEIYSVKLQINQVFAWSDSSVALSWIKSAPHRWKTFVSNRVSHIQDKVSPDRWFHIRSAENPADCASRGIFPTQLVNHSLWWAGPPWLQLPHQSWPANEVKLGDVSDVCEEERKLTLATFASLEALDSLLERFSSLSKIKRIISYCLRFVSNTKRSTHKRSGAFTSQELHEALLIMIKRVQSLVFHDVIDNLERKHSIPKSLRRLNPFIGDDGVLRVGGRLTHSRLLYDQKHPALLPSKHRLTELIIEDAHQEHLHPGQQTLHFLLSQNFWILSPKRTIRSCLSKCLRCFKVNPKPFQPSMGDLPAVRVNQIKPFQNVGVDYAGPVFITLGKSRGIKSQKAYICLFICVATKAIHLELASDLTTDCFLAALRRFISRRGRCSHLFSDCGSNFIGANRELANFTKQAAETEKILWSFNPPSAPHFGGLWESGVKSMKSHLIRVIGDQILTYEEMYTVLVQIEAVLNSRPLYPLSSDPQDLSVLTPGHFLTLEPLTTLSDPDLSLIPINRLTRWQLIQRLQRDFWKRWHLEYLHTLQQRNKWFHSEPQSIVPGTLVLIKNELSPPLKWLLGRIETLYPGKDGICRVASVRTCQGLMQRPLVKLCPLPISPQTQ